MCAKTTWLVKKRTSLLLVVVCSAVIYTFTLDPLPQKQTYHAFADSTGFWLMPSVLNVLSNIAFVVVGIIGWARLRKLAVSPSIHIWRLMFLSVALVGLGSAWYHYTPCLLYTSDAADE